MNSDGAVLINGARIRFQTVGDGPPLVVQPPGWGIGVGLYAATYLPLAETHTLVFYDTRGSGNSQRDVDPATINVGQFVDDLHALSEHLGLERFALTGHSHGGYIALNYALRHPEQLTHLILVDAQVGVEEPGADMARLIPQMAQLPQYADAAAAFTNEWDLSSDETFGALLYRGLPLYFHDVQIAEPVRAGVAASPPAVAAYLATHATNAQFLVRERLGEITTPTLVIVGRHDFICSTIQADVLHAGIPNSELCVFEHSGHLPWLEEPEAFFSAVRGFLE